MVSKWIAGKQLRLLSSIRPGQYHHYCWMMMMMMMMMVMMMMMIMMMMVKLIKRQVENPLGAE